MLLFSLSFPLFSARRALVSKSGHACNPTCSHPRPSDITTLSHTLCVSGCFPWFVYGSVWWFWLHRGTGQIKLPGMEKVCPANQASLFPPILYPMELLFVWLLHTDTDVAALDAYCAAKTQMKIVKHNSWAGTTNRRSISCPCWEKTGVSTHSATGRTIYSRPWWLMERILGSMSLIFSLGCLCVFVKFCCL